MEEKDLHPSLLPRLIGGRDLQDSTYVKGLVKLALEHAPRILIDQFTKPNLPCLRVLQRQQSGQRPANQGQMLVRQP